MMPPTLMSSIQLCCPPSKSAHTLIMTLVAEDVTGSPCDGVLALARVWLRRPTDPPERARVRWQSRRLTALRRVSPCSNDGSSIRIDLIDVFYISLLLRVLVSIVLILEVITILGYCPLLSSRGPA